MECIHIDTNEKFSEKIILIYNLFHEMFSNKQNLKHEYILYNYFNLRE